MSAVSKKLIPQSRAASTTAAAPPASVRQPELLQPIPTGEMSRDPSWRYSIGELTYLWHFCPWISGRFAAITLAATVFFDVRFKIGCSSHHPFVSLFCGLG